MSEPEKTAVLAREGFDEESFRAPKKGGWAEARPVTYLREPWENVVFESERMAFGHSSDNPRSGNGCLRMTGNEQTRLTRSFPARSGEWLAGQVWCRGLINPGTYVAMEMRFYNSKGQPLVGRETAVLHPANYADWQLVTVAGRAPYGTVRVEVMLRAMSQEAEETLDWDDFLLMKLKADEN